MKDEKTLTDEDIKTLKQDAKVRVPEILKSVKYRMVEAERAGSTSVTLPLSSMRQIFGYLAITSGAFGVRPFDLDPKDPVNIDADPTDPVSGVDADPKDAPQWDFDTTDP